MILTFVWVDYDYYEEKLGYMIYMIFSDLCTSVTWPIVYFKTLCTLFINACKTRNFDDI